MNLNYIKKLEVMVGCLPGASYTPRMEENYGNCRKLK
jgi:hypothetical protein